MQSGQTFAIIFLTLDILKSPQCLFVFKFIDLWHSYFLGFLSRVRVQGCLSLSSERNFLGRQSELVTIIRQLQNLSLLWNTANKATVIMVAYSMNKKPHGSTLKFKRSSDWFSEHDQQSMRMAIMSQSKGASNLTSSDWKQPARKECKNTERFP